MRLIDADAIEYCNDDSNLESFAYVRKGTINAMPTIDSPCGISADALKEMKVGVADFISSPEYKRGWNAALDYAARNAPTIEITDEQAYEHLAKSGWLLEHDAAMIEKGMERQRKLTIEAEPIVRCKDCKHRIVNEHYGEKGYMKLKAMCEHDTGDPFERGRCAENDEWFCADGAKMDEVEE